MATPSSEGASRLLAATGQRRIDLTDALSLLSGCVGDGAALELAAWMRDLDLPDPEVLLAAQQMMMMTSLRSAGVVIVSAPPWLLPCTPMRVGSTSGRVSTKSTAQQASTAAAPVAVRVPVNEVVQEQARIAGVVAAV